MAVYNNKTEQWKPFASSGQKGKSNSFLVNDGTTNYPIFHSDWSLEKFRNTSGFSDISYTFNSGVVTAAKHNPAAINVGPTDSFLHSSNILPETFTDIMRGPEYIYFSYWVKINTEKASSGNVGHCVFSLLTSAATGLFFYISKNQKPGVLMVGESNSTSLFSSVESSSSIVVGSWHHILVKTKRNDSTTYTEDIIGDDAVDSDFAWHVNTDIYIDGVLQVPQITDLHQDLNHDLAAPPMKFQVGGNGYIGIGSNSTLLASTGFNGALGPLKIYIGEERLANLFYSLEKFGAVHQHSGIHSHPVKTMKKQLDRNINYPAHFGGLDANYNGLGLGQYIEDESSWVDPDSVSYLGLAGTDSFLDTWRSPSKSVLYEDDLDSTLNLGFEIREKVGSTSLYQTAIAEPTGILPFSDSKSIGTFGDNQYTDQIVIEIPLEVLASTILGEQSNVVDPYPLGKQSGDKHIAYYNFQTKGFDLLESGSIAFSAGQGIGLDVEIPFSESIKSICRPTSAYGFPATDNYKQATTNTLKLSDYIKDAFILEGYELELDTSVSESTDIVGGGITGHYPGLGWHLYTNVVKSEQYYNPFGVSITNSTSLPQEMDSVFANSFGTKILTSFLLRQTKVNIQQENYEEKTKVVSTHLFESADPASALGYDYGLTVSSISDINADLGIGYHDIETQRELITYGQTVLHVKSEAWLDSIEEIYPPVINGDGGNQLMMASIPHQSYGEFPSIYGALGEREQYIQANNLKEIANNLNVQISQVADIKSNNVAITNLPFREYLWYSDFVDAGVGVNTLADPNNELIQSRVITGGWAGGHNIFDTIESRGTTAVVGSIDNREYRTAISPALIDTNFNIVAGKWINTEKVDQARESSFTSSEPVAPQDGYILYPEDELILGVQNSVSEKLESIQYEGDPINSTETAQKIISSSEMQINAVPGTLRLFGRYKREDKFQIPTQNFSLYHNIEANEAIGSEDIRDVFELEPLMSYQGSMRDDIVAPFNLIDNTYQYIIQIDDNLAETKLISSPGVIKEYFSDIFNGVSNPTILPTTLKASDFSQLASPGYSDLEITGWQNPADKLLLDLLIGTASYPDTIYSVPPEITLGFLTSDDNKLCTLATPTTVGFSSGGNNIRELTSTGYIPDSSSVLFGTNFETRTLNGVGGSSGSRRASAVSLTKLYIPLPVYTPAYGAIPLIKEFLLVAVDSGAPPAVTKHSDNTTINIQLGSAFYFDVTDDEFYLYEANYSHGVHNIQTYFIVAGYGVTETDSSTYYYWLDESNIFTTAMSYYQFFDYVYDIIEDHKTFDSSILINLTKVMNTSIVPKTMGIQMDFPDEEKIREIFRLYESEFTSLISKNSRLFKKSDLLQAAAYNPLESEVHEKLYILQDDSLGGVEYLGTGAADEIRDKITIDWSASLIPDVTVVDEIVESPSRSALFAIDLTKIDRKVIARTTELTAKTDIFGNTPGVEAYGGGYRSAGSLGSLKKVQIHTMVNEAGALLTYEDSMTPEVSNDPLDISVGSTLSTGWIHLDSGLQKIANINGRKYRNLKSDPIFTWSADAQSGTNSFPTTGLYERLSISLTNQSGVEWPYSGYTQGSQDETIPVVSELTHEFPELFDGFKTYTNLWFGLGSLPGNKIKVFPRTAEFLAWTSTGPVSWTGEMQHEPIRGTRYGMMNTSPIAATCKFSSRSFGQPRDLYEGIIDSAIAQYSLDNPDYGSPVQVKIYSASNFGVLRGNTGAPAEHPTRSNIDEFQRVYYPWIDDVIHWGGIPGHIENIFPSTAIADYRRNNIKINEAIALSLTPEANTSPSTAAEINRPTTASTRETSRIDLLGSIKSNKVKKPGNLRSKITKR